MFLFGVLKFFDPFRSWYSVQINSSGFDAGAYWMGISGEIVAGLTLLSVAIFIKKSSVVARLAVQGACILIVVMMATGIYVHLHPNVPAEVLPLKIKPPYIPAFFLALAVLNLVLGKCQKVASII